MNFNTISPNNFSSIRESEIEKEEIEDKITETTQDIFSSLDHSNSDFDSFYNTIEELNMSDIYENDYSVNDTDNLDENYISNLINRNQKKLIPLLDKIAPIREEFNEWEANLQKIESIQHVKTWEFTIKVLCMLLKLIKNTDTNKDTLLEIAQFFSSAEQLEPVKNAANIGSEGFKWFNPFSKIIIYTIQSILIHYARKELCQHRKKFQLLEKEFEGVLLSFDQDFQEKNLDKKIIKQYFIAELINEKNLLETNLKNSEQKLADQKSCSFSKMLNNLKKILGKSFALIFIQLLEVSKKGSTQVCKNVLILIEEIIEYNQKRKSHRLLNEWKFHLQPPRLYTTYNEEIEIDDQKDSSEEIKQLKLEQINKQNKEKLIHQKWMDEQLSTDNTIKEKWEEFLFSLQHAESIKEVTKKFRRNKITLEIPEELEDWKELIKKPPFQRYLMLSFFENAGRFYILGDQNTNKYESQIDINTSSDLLLKRIEILNDSRIEKAKKIEEDVHNFLINAINDGNSIEQINDNLKSKHMQILKLTDPKTESTYDLCESRDELEQMLLNCQVNSDWDDLCKQLAFQRVEYHETVASLTEQALRQSLLLKIKVESKFFYFNQVMGGVNFVFSLIQIVLASPFKKFSFTANHANKLEIVATVFNFLAINLCKSAIPGMGLILLLYPDLTLKLLSILKDITFLIFYRLYKPNQSSLLGYKIGLQILYFTTISSLLQYMSALEQTLSWIKVKIESLVKSYLPFAFGSEINEGDPNSNPIDQKGKLESKLLDYQYRISQKNIELNQLRSLDLAIILQFKSMFSTVPTTDIPDPEADSSYNPCSLLADIMVDSLNETDLNLFPEKFLQFLKMNMDVNIEHCIPIDKEMDPDSAKDKKYDLKNQLENLFYLEESDFVRFYQTTRFKHLISTKSSLLTPVQ